AFVCGALGLLLVFKRTTLRQAEQIHPHTKTVNDTVKTFLYFLVHAQLFRINSHTLPLQGIGTNDKIKLIGQTAILRTIFLLHLFYVLFIKRCKTMLISRHVSEYAQCSTLF